MELIPSRLAGALLTAAGAALLVPSAATGQIVQRAVYVPEGSFQLATATGSVPGDPRDLGTDPDGNVHVVDRDGVVHVYAAAGAHLRSYGAGTLDDPIAVVVHPGGTVYVLDEGRKRVYAFDAGGELLGSWGGGGSRAGQLDDPKDLALGPNGYAYVLDKGQKSVHVFSAGGVFVRSVLYGDAIRDPAALAVAPDGTIFVTDKDAEGWIYTLPSFADAQWGAAPTLVPAGQLPLRGAALDEPLGVAVNRFGTAVVVDEDTGVLWMRNVGESQPAGPDDRLYGGVGDAPGGFREATAVAFADDDEILVLDRRLRKVERVRLTTEGERAELEAFSYPIRVARGEEPPGGLVHAVGYDGDDPVFLVSHGRRAISLAGAGGENLVALTPTDGYDRVAGGALNDSLVVVTDRGRDRFSVFARNDGRWLVDFGQNYEDRRRLDDPAGVAVRPDGSVVVADRRNHRIVWISPDRTQILTSFPFRDAWGVARSHRDRVVVWSENGEQVYLIDDLREGTSPRLFGGALVPPRVAGAAFDDAGNLYLLDGESGRVTVLSFELDRILFQVGNHEDVRRPRGLAVDRDGNIYVADEDGPRTVVYRWEVQAGPPEDVTVAYDDAAAVLAWAPGPRSFIRHYRVEGTPGPGVPYRALETAEDTVYRLEVAGVDEAFPRQLRVVPVFITGASGEASEPVGIVDLTARVAFREERWEIAWDDAGFALAGLEDGDPAAGEFRWIRFRSAQEREDHAEVVRLAAIVEERVPEEELGEFHLSIMRAHRALGDVPETAERFLRAAAALDPERLRDDSVSVVPFRIFQALDSAGARGEAIEFLRGLSRDLPDELAELRQVYQDSVQVFEVREVLGEGFEALRDADIQTAQEFFEERLASGELRNSRQVIVAMFAAAIAAQVRRRGSEAADWFRQIYEDDPAFSFEENFERIVRLYGLGFYDSPELREFFLEMEREIKGDPGEPGDEDGGS